MVIVFLVILLEDFYKVLCDERKFSQFFANSRNYLWGEEKRISKRQKSNVFEQKMAPKHFLEYFQ